MTRLAPDSTSYDIPALVPRRMRYSPPPAPRGDARSGPRRGSCRVATDDAPPSARIPGADTVRWPHRCPQRSRATACAHHPRSPHRPGRSSAQCRRPHGGAPARPTGRRHVGRRRQSPAHGSGRRARPARRRDRRVQRTRNSTSAASASATRGSPARAGGSARAGPGRPAAREAARPAGPATRRRRSPRSPPRPQHASGAIRPWSTARALIGAPFRVQWGSPRHETIRVVMGQRPRQVQHSRDRSGPERPGQHPRPPPRGAAGWSRRTRAARSRRRGRAQHRGSGAWVSTRGTSSGGRRLTVRPWHIAGTVTRTLPQPRSAEQATPTQPTISSSPAPRRRYSSAPPSCVTRRSTSAVPRSPRIASWIGTTTRGRTART